MSEKHDQQWDYKIRCNSHNEDIVFNGKEVASHSSRKTYGDSQNRYNCLDLYQTESGKYVLVDEYVTHWQGEEGTKNVYICENLDEVKSYFTDREGKLSEWEKEFLEDAGISLVKEI